jgi:hypothetical protein
MVSNLNDSYVRSLIYSKSSKPQSTNLSNILNNIEIGLEDCLYSDFIIEKNL